MSDTRDLKAAGDYLLSRLRKKRFITYRELALSGPKARDRLAKGIWSFTKGYPSSDATALPSHTTESYFRARGGELVRDAAWQLDDLDIIRIHFPGADASGGQWELAFELTDRGKRFLEGGESFGYRKVRFNRFDFAPASLWLLDFALAGVGPVTLRAAMEEAERSGSVVVTDDSGNRYTTAATNTFAWAFEAALWHHAVNRHVEPAGTTRLPRLWKELCRQGAPPPRPPAGGPQPIRDVPFRLAPGLDLNDVWHLGVVVGG